LSRAASFGRERRGVNEHIDHQVIDPGTI
jgi:hypothetical protein